MGPLRDCLWFQDDGDALIVPAPLYPAFCIDVGMRAGVTIVPTEPGPISKGRLEAAAQRARDDGHRVGGVLLTSPCNPRGCLHSRAEAAAVEDFVVEHGLHLIHDAVYGKFFPATLSLCLCYMVCEFTTLHDPKLTPSSQAIHDDLLLLVVSWSILTDRLIVILAGTVFDERQAAEALPRLPAAHRESLHTIWGLSKDFGLSGWRLGVRFDLF